MALERPRWPGLYLVLQLHLLPDDLLLSTRPSPGPAFYSWMCKALSLLKAFKHAGPSSLEHSSLRFSSDFHCRCDLLRSPLWPSSKVSYNHPKRYFNPWPCSVFFKALHFLKLFYLYLFMVCLFKKPASSLDVEPLPWSPLYFLCAQECVVQSRSSVNLWWINASKGSISNLMWCGLVAKMCLTLGTPWPCSPLGFSVHGISQARILEWVAIPFSTGSS